MKQINHSKEYYQNTIKRLKAKIKQLEKKQRELKKLLKAKISD